MAAWRFRRIPALLFALLLLAPAPPAAAGAPIVVELFTAQGCDSCPAAKAAFRRLAQRDDILALAFHVDYWNYTGWSDPFASREASERQRAYSRRFGLNYLYTPQLVINGRLELPATDRAGLERLLASTEGPDTGTLVLGHDANGLRIAFDAPPGTGEATVWLVLYNRRYVTEVTGGSNAGTVMGNDNVVRRLSALGTWRGEPLELYVRAADLHVGPAMPDACAIIVQEGGEGAILAAGRIVLEATAGGP